jgi:hypothetical protein
MKYLQKLPILFLIALICSMTPAMALQTDGMSNDCSSEWDKGVDEIIKVIEGDDTELTPEQSTYLETHQDQVQIKGEAVLTSLQLYINYLMKEYNEYYSQTDKQAPPTQRNLLEIKDSEYSKYSSQIKQSNTQKVQKIKDDKYGDDLTKVVNYLKTINIPTKTDSLGYNNLSDNWEKNVYGDDDGVIIQIDDRGYVRYMKLVSISRTNIHVRSDKKDITISFDTFKNMYLPNEDINIIIVPKNYDTTITLHDVLTFKRDNLNANINWCTWGQSICIPVTVLGISGIVLNGVWKCCDKCKSKAANDVKKPEPDEKSPLLQRYDEEKAEIQEDASCCKKPRTIIVLGVLITLGAFTGSIISVALKNCYETDLKNLGDYV